MDFYSLEGIPLINYTKLTYYIIQWTYSYKCGSNIYTNVFRPYVITYGYKL